MPRLRRPHIAGAQARARSLTVQTATKARRAKWEMIVVVPLLAMTLYAYLRREELFGVDTPVRVGAAIVMVVLGWALARDLGRFTAPALFRRMDPATAGTVGFLIRLVFIVAAALFALRVAGLQPATLAVGGAITAVVFGLAAQQTLGNLIAGMVLISARPFKVGDRVRLQAGGPDRGRRRLARAALHHVQPGP
jgi:small conductance mechanosensitive channel